MLHQGSSTKQLHNRPCILCIAQNAAPVRSHLAPLRRNVRTPFRVSEPSDTQNSRDQEEETCTAQQLPPPDHLPAMSQHQPANPYPLKNAQLGHSRFSRGAPHICYGQVGSSGVFYVKPEVDDLVDDWQQWFAGQQQQWVAGPQQQWQQQRRHVEAWMHAQQGLFSGLHCPPGAATAGVRTTSRLEFQPGTGNSGCTTAVGTQNSSCGDSGTGGNAAGATDEVEDRQSLLNSIHGKSGAAGSLGIAVTLAAAVVAALKSSYLRSHGSAQRLLLGAAVGVSAVLLLMQCSKWLVAALFLCYAGISVL